jgi:hypothetical protein
MSSRTPAEAGAENRQPRSNRLAKCFKGFFVLAVVNLGLLLGLDLILVKLDLLGPPFAYGTPDVGFGKPGVRTSAHHGVPRISTPEAIAITMVGDSHSELVFGNPLDTHEFVLEAVLRDAGVPINMISAGRGRYSPLQEYILFKLQLKRAFAPRVLVMNFYSGNDFYDMLRPDDRPHFERDGQSIVIREPLWITYVDPSKRSWIQRSRLLWGIDELSSRFGLPRVITRLRMVSAAASQTDRPLTDTLRYLADLRRSEESRLSYPAAFAAQILNQALFFHHFPGSTRESLAFMRHLMQRIRAENPDMLLVFASIPSAALMDAIPHDVQRLWRETLDRTGLTEAQVGELENGLVNELKTAAVETGWLFVDLRDCLRAAPHSGELYSAEDLHISATASRLIGGCQAEALLASESFMGSVVPVGGRRPSARAVASISR